jgi:DNA polymerase I-like protein with 3'-5' exonuclease and polymerase domains
LARLYGVGYCAEASPGYAMARDRIVVPFYQRGQLVGWQARFVGERNWRTCHVPKYYTMPGLAKASLLYNLDQASQSPVVVVCEGVTDVWRVGPQAVALLGHDPSPNQMSLLVSVWGRGRVVLLLDGDAATSTNCYAAELRRRLPGGVVVAVTLPADVDPGDLSRQEVWARIHDAARQQGVDLDVPTLGPAACVTAEAGSSPLPEVRSLETDDPNRILAQLLDEENPGRLVNEPEEVLATRAVEEGLGFVLCEIELPVAEGPVRAMRQNNIRVDYDLLVELNAEFQHQQQVAQTEIYRAAGHRLNLDSHSEVVDLLYRQLRLPVVSRTETGAPSLTDRTLQRLGTLHSAATWVLHHRTFRRLSTAVTQLLTSADPVTWRVHPHLDPLGTVTGRFACSNPPIQGMPKELHSVVVAEEGYSLVEADFSTFELRVLAHLSQDPGLIHAFREGADLHRRTASLALGVAEGEVTTKQRDHVGKVVNFGIIYGQTPFGLADELNITVEQAAEFLEGFLAGYPGVRRWTDSVHHYARQHGYVATLFGRRRRFPRLGAAPPWEEAAMLRQAANAVIQGTAADINKLALLRLHRELSSDCRLLLTVHDSVLIEVPRSRVPEVAHQVRDIMELLPEGFSVPLEVDVGWGENWEECKQNKVARRP